jgi:hypothetical protein
MDQNGPPILPCDFLLRPASGRTSADLDLLPEPCRNDLPDRSSVAVYYRDEAEVRDGFQIALRAMGFAGVEQHFEPATPPAAGAKP